MSDNLTGKNLKTYFQKCSSENGKILLASVTDDTVADNIALFFQSDGGVEFCKECINSYIKNTKNIGVTLSDFVMNLTTIKDAINQSKIEAEEIKRIMAKTRQKMEGLN